MKDDERFSRIAKVLFYGTLDESFAIEKAADIFVSPSEEMLKKINNCLQSHFRSGKEARSVIQGNFSFLNSIDIGYWKQFVRNSDEDYFCPILYKWVGDFTDQEIMEVLSISLGSLRSRYNKGLLQLGKFLLDGSGVG